MRLLSSVLRGLGKLIAYMVMAFLCFLIFMAGVGILLKVMYSIFQSEGPKLQEEKVEKEVIPRVTNGTYSFCFVRNGKQYYFEVLGWVKPNSTVLKRYLSLFDYGVSWGGAYSLYGKGLIVFLKVRTNLDWKWYITEAECRVGELYKECFLGSIDYAIRINNDTFLIPYVLKDEFWESYKIIKEYYLNTSDIRLYFEVDNFLELEEGDVIKVGKIILTCIGRIEREELGIYIEYPRPNFSVSIEDVKYLGYDGWGHHLFNVTLRLEDIGMVVEYTFDEFGRKERLSEEFIPIYMLTVDTIPSWETWIVGRFNESHYLLALPTTSCLRYFFGGGFKDVWKEPQHEYIGSYASSGENIWLRIEIFHEHVVGGTLAFVTPWGQVYEVKISTEG